MKAPYNAPAERLRRQKVALSHLPAKVKDQPGKDRAVFGGRQLITNPRTQAQLDHERQVLTAAVDNKREYHFS